MPQPANNALILHSHEIAAAYIIPRFRSLRNSESISNIKHRPDPKIAEWTAFFCVFVQDKTTKYTFPLLEHEKDTVSTGMETSTDNQSSMLPSL